MKALYNELVSLLEDAAGGAGLILNAWSQSMVLVRNVPAPYIQIGVGMFEQSNPKYRVMRKGVKDCPGDLVLKIVESK